MSRTGPPPGLWSNGSSPSNQSSNNSSTNSTSSLLTIVKAQIVFLLSTLTEENWSKNRDEIRSLIELHGPEPQLHFIRRLVTASFSSPSSPVPSPLVIKLLCTEVVRMSRDTILAERFKEAINPTLDSTSTETLSTFSLEALLALPGLTELSALEKLVFCSPFLNLLNSVENSGTNLGKAAASTIHSVLSAALEQLSAPPSSPSDLPELSPLSISKLFSILLSDLYIDETQVFSDEERRSIIMGAVRGRLGAEVGSQALTHAFSEMTFSTTSPPSVISILTRLSPALALCSLDLVRAILLRFGGLTSGSEGEGGNELRVTTMLFALVDLATVDAELAGSIDLANFVKGIYELVPGLKWGEVVRGYDNPLRGLPDSWGLRLFAAFLPLSPSSNGSGLMCGEGGNSAIEGLWGKWTNPTIQFNLLERLIYLPLDSFNLSTLSSITKVVSLEDGMRSSPTVKGLVQGVVGSQWNCKELIGVLVGLGSENATTELGGRVRELLERAIKAAPELVLIALIQLDKPWSTLHLALIARLLSIFLTGHPSHQLVFLKIYQSDSSFLLAALQDFYAESEINITRILDIAQDLKILEQVLELRPFFLALDLAALASRREYLNLEKWLSTGIEKLGGVFVRATLEFVGHKVRHDLTRQGGGEGEGAEVSTVGLSAGTVALFMRALRLHHELFTGNDVELFKEVRTQCLQLYPRLMNFSPGNIDSEAGMSVVNFTAEIEAEVDASYQKMYDAEISVENVVAGLQRAKQSDNQHDHEFLACFLHGLFEEHRFFNTYPPIQLTLTANLFGDLIQFQLIDFIPLGIAVRYVLDALRNPPDSTWFSFGIQALGRFSSRLEEWPQLAHSILAIDHLELSNPEVIQFARAALLARERGEGLDLGGEDREEIILDQVGLEPLEEMERPSFTAIAVVLDGEALVEPAEEIMDKILFIINNLAPSNFDEKVLEMADKMEISHFNWFAHYIVAQRVSIEPNNHGLYLKFLDSLAKPLLIKRVLYETFIKLETLLNSEKTVQSSTERTLLKNLGSWLGSLTLAKNKPIKQTNIAFKELLIQGYDSNRLIVAIPFVCKVLEQCSKSKVFKPPNPWLMAILRLLVELYQFAELKLNLKFEIEVLCKSLNVDLKEMEASDILRNRVKEN